MFSKTKILLLAYSLIAFAQATPRKKIIDGVTYHILEAQANAVKVVWKNKEGKQLQSLPWYPRRKSRTRLSVFIDAGFVAVEEEIEVREIRYFPIPSTLTTSAASFLEPSGV